MFGALDAARRAGLPYVVLEHLYDSYYERAACGARWAWPAPCAAARRGAPLAAATLRLATTLPALDAAGPTVRQVGAGGVLDRVCRRRRRAPEPMVLVSLSTFAFPGMTDASQRLLDATRGLDARVVVTTGPAVDPAELPVPPTWRCTASSRTTS